MASTASWIGALTEAVKAGIEVYKAIRGEGPPGALRPVQPPLERDAQRRNAYVAARRLGHFPTMEGACFYCGATLPSRIRCTGFRREPPLAKPRGEA